MELLTTPEFDEWFNDLRDQKTKGRISSRLDRVQRGNFGDHKSVGDGVSELRLDFGPGFRVYYTERNGIVIVLLFGGDKDSQERDIEKAKAIAAALED